MQIDITGQQTEITDALRARVQKALARVGKRGEFVIARAHVVLSVAKRRHRCDARLDVNGGAYVAKSESQDMYAAIDRTMQKIARQLGAAKRRRPHDRRDK